MDYPSPHGAFSSLQNHQPFPPSPPQSRRASEDIDLLPPLTKCPGEILELDKHTPDSHVPRDQRLIRLTGSHPFNAEAPLSDLLNDGFLTSPELFYVRNHGPVPKIQNQEILNWQLTVEGCVENSMCLTIQDLISDYNQISCPVTLVCAGNRRKEQNQLKKSKGFSWGAGGVSTAIFTGVLMADLIKKARPRRGAKFVCMEGADELPNGCYGTSVKLNWVMDPNRGIMLAYKMNGENLRPDHGKPLRAVVPGQIGGRSVKWLRRLVVTETPSENWYHLYDNRVLPTMISPEQSVKNPELFKDDRYAIYDLSTNSAMVHPEHDERVLINCGSEIYRAKGYAYGGGGRRISRVELSLDKGRSWRLADIDYKEDRYRELDKDMYGGRIDMFWRETCFCWCFWSLDISLLELADATDILLRAMDESMNVQPKDMYWNVLGMMNNPWFRVTVIKEGEFLRFEHPTQPGLQPGGWMERAKKAGGDLANGQWGEENSGAPKEEKLIEETNEVTMTKHGLTRLITIDELRKHGNEQDPWFVLYGEVYAGVSFLQEHPGGSQSILGMAGLDASEEFMAIHSETAKSMMQVYHIGTLDPASVLLLGAESGNEARHKEDPVEPEPVFLKPQSWTQAVLHSKQPISSDTRIFSFKLSHARQSLGLTIGQHLFLRLRDPLTKKVIIRPYTPISPPSQTGSVDLLIKIYPTDTATSSSIKSGGRPKMTQLLDILPLGQVVDMKGPTGKLSYLGQGLCTISNSPPQRFTHFIMICAGTGIAPILQVYRAVMSDPDDNTQCTILYGNRRRADILCKDDLETLAAGPKSGSDSGPVPMPRITYTLSQPPSSDEEEEWYGLRGRIDAEMIRQCLGSVPGNSSNGSRLVMICGPEGMEEMVRQVLLEEEGRWRRGQILVF